MNDWHARSISEIVLESGTDANFGRSVQDSDRKRKKNNRTYDDCKHILSFRFFCHKYFSVKVLIYTKRKYYA